MRKDLNKLLCERERPGSARGHRQVRNTKERRLLDEDGYPMGGREGIRRPYREDRKPFGENLNPLYGTIRKNVNRPWDKVYSELCEVFDMRSVINQHILVHLWQWVEKDTCEEDGVVYVRNRWNGSVPLKESSAEFYIHPRTGLLLKNKWYKHYKSTWREDAEAKRLKTVRKIGPNLEARRRDENGVWFICEMGDIPKTEVRKIFDVNLGYVDKEIVGQRNDAWEGKAVTYGEAKPWQEHHGFHSMTAYVIKYHTASTKELKKYGLVNGYNEEDGGLSHRELSKYRKAA